MKVGLSTYSLHQAFEKGAMTLLEEIEWIAAQGGEHVEIVPFEFTLTAEMVGEVRKKAQSVGIEISSYTIEANFIQPTEEAYQTEIVRVKSEVDVAAQLGVKLMRHDAGSRPPAEATILNFQQDLPKVAAACREVADHAAGYGITTSVENHGYHFQHSDRVQQLVAAVNRPNYKTTLDVGNFLCVDEDPLVAVKKNISLASMVHLKDFYYRPADQDPGEGWFQSASGNHLRGAIVGQGDLDMRRILKVVKASGYDGYLSIEFEGLEECLMASRIGMENARRLWTQV